MIADTPPVVIETKPERQVVGMARAFTMETRHEIPALYNAFFDAGYEIGNTVPGGVFGVSFSADGTGGFRYGVGFEVAPSPSEIPEGTCRMSLSDGDYAVLRAFGPVSQLPARFDWLFSSWLPTADVAQRAGAVVEFYPEDARNGPDGIAYEIWVPVTRVA